MNHSLKSWPFKNWNFVHQQWPFIYQTFQLQLLTRYKGAGKTCCLHLIGVGLRHFGGNALPQGVKDRNHLLGPPKTEGFWRIHGKKSRPPQKTHRISSKIPTWDKRYHFGCQKPAQCQAGFQWYSWAISLFHWVQWEFLDSPSQEFLEFQTGWDSEKVGINTKHCKW